MAFELVADGRPDEIGTVGIESFLHHQIDVTEVNVAKVDRDLLGFRSLGSQLAYIVGHGNIREAIQWDGNRMVYGCLSEDVKGPANITRIFDGCECGLRSADV